MTTTIYRDIDDIREAYNLISDIKESIEECRILDPDDPRLVYLIDFMATITFELGTYNPVMIMGI